jgi:hypothetical protein
LTEKILERNYHIFYQLTKGTNDEEKRTLFLTNPESYHYTNQSNCIDVQVFFTSFFFFFVKLEAKLHVEFKIQMKNLRLFLKF